MNINVGLPPMIPNQLHPQTESARTDNRRTELVPQARQGEASAAESGVASQKDQSRAAQANPAAQSSRESTPASPTAAPQRFVDATDEDGKRRQQESGQQEQQKQQQRVERGREMRQHEQVRAASLALADPSSQDLSVARTATLKEVQARRELMVVEPASGASGPLGAYMDRRNQIIAQHYRQAVRPTPRQSFSLDV
ncbi:hypothetical protein [Aeromonas sp. sif2416]|uniref:hypothetical protein n=1 Tax=Aeromonas sp. sif2416 TaxID=2854793 RepID=UPI001C478262|nr:hypothetical protein [Aeromonas sp. sif2416]MBV7439278.1 hypothetical protein [Aeromonas sp. sif2416]